MPYMRFLALALCLSACGLGQDDEFRRAIPGKDTVTIHAPEGNGNALSLGEQSEYYGTTRKISREVNGGVAAIVGLIKMIVEQPATSRDGDRRIWGPGGDALDPVIYRFVATKVGEGQFDYTLDYRAKDSADEESNYTALIDGHSDVSSGEDDGVGDMTLYIDRWAAIEPGACGSGTLHVTYDTTQEPKHLTVDFDDFSDTCEGEGHKALSAATYYYARMQDGSGNFQFSAQGDIDHGDVTPAVNELLVIRSRWTASGAGRSDVRISGGDMAANHSIAEVTASECWDELFKLTHADIDPAAVDPARDDLGDAGSCAFADAEYATDL
jgi:hypothetical protein